MKIFKFTKEGLPIDSREVRDRVIAAMSAAILHISEKFVKEYGYGNLKRVLIHAEEEILMLEEKEEKGRLSILKADDKFSFLSLSLLS